MSILDLINGDEQANVYQRRLNTLKKQGRQTEHISNGVTDVMAKLSKGVNSLVVYGEPQSGKTEFMIALVCRLIDEGRKTIFIVMNDNTELENQNYKRFKRVQEIPISPLKYQEFLDLPESDKKSENTKIIFCRKNGNNLRKIIKEARFLKDRIVLDDEADFASPDTKINKEGDSPSTINQLLGELGGLPPKGSGVYIGVTATPGRLDLNNTFLNDSAEWVFLKSHSRYKGRQFFFPIKEQDGGLKYILTRLPEQGDDPKHLKQAFLRYLVRAAILNLKDGLNEVPIAYSMLVHTDGKTNSHIADMKQLQKHLSVIKNQSGPIEAYLTYMKSEAERVITDKGLNINSLEALKFILSNISKSTILQLNHKNDKANVEEACNPNDTFTIAVGGNIVSRGLTFDRLLTFFFSRGVKGKLQQNTYIQRARMFGTREYSELFELCVPGKLFEDWADCFTDHELSLRSAMAGDYVHIHSASNRPSDSSSIDKKNTISARSEWLLGSVQEIPPHFEEKFTSSNLRPLDLIESLLATNELLNATFNRNFLDFIRETSADDQSDIGIVMSESGFYLLDRTDADEETITRKRGGLVASVIKGRPKYMDKLHIIMPAKNNRGEMRFHYKNQLGKKVLKNIIR